MPAPRNRNARRVSSTRPGAKPGATLTTRSTQAADKRWRRDARPEALRAAVHRTKGLRWSASLLELLIEELYIDESIEALLGQHPHALPTRRYPEAIAVALILRHSWRADDLACIIERLGLNRGTRARRKSTANASRAVRRRVRIDRPADVELGARRRPEVKARLVELTRPCLPDDILDAGAYRTAAFLAGS